MSKSKMININFDDGFKEIRLNQDDNRIVRWNPSDINILDRFMNLVSWFENDYEILAKEAGIKDGLDLESYKQGSILKFGELINSKINEAFNSNVTEAAFQGSNPATPTSSGPICLNFVEAMSPLIEDSVSEVNKDKNKYTEKAIKNKKQLKA